MPSDQESSEQTEVNISYNAHNSENSLDWGATYKGNVYCSSCNGTINSVVLNYNNTYRMTVRHANNKISTEQGEIIWDASGSYITLKNNKKVMFAVGEAGIFLTPSMASNNWDEKNMLEKQWE